MNCALTLADGSDVDAYAAAARGAGRTGRVHLKVDTGMGRLGVRPEHAPGVAQRVAYFVGRHGAPGHGPAFDPLVLAIGFDDDA